MLEVALKSNIGSLNPVSLATGADLTTLEPNSYHLPVTDDAIAAAISATADLSAADMFVALQQTEVKEEVVTESEGVDRG